MALAAFRGQVVHGGDQLGADRVGDRGGCRRVRIVDRDVDDRGVGGHGHLDVFSQRGGGGGQRDPGDHRLQDEWRRRHLDVRLDLFLRERCALSKITRRRRTVHREEKCRFRGVHRSQKETQDCSAEDAEYGDGRDTAPVFSQHRQVIPQFHPAPSSSRRTGPR
ncbi:hypothetical protein SDC9_99972 [bioreactor metagenome]|uniref:Uncharacterized protein n=1 Tax=bioreactor metagenome TaxID=1076179 RepID=A0A645AJK1_9ZZZZ